MPGSMSVSVSVTQTCPFSFFWKMWQYMKCCLANLEWFARPSKYSTLVHVWYLLQHESLVFDSRRCIFLQYSKMPFNLRYVLLRQTKIADWMCIFVQICVCCLFFFTLNLESCTLSACEKSVSFGNMYFLFVSWMFLFICVFRECWTSRLVTSCISIGPDIRQDYPLNLSILLSGGKETNKDFPSNGEWSGKSSSLKSLYKFCIANCSLMKRGQCRYDGQVPWKRTA